MQHREHVQKNARRRDEAREEMEEEEEEKEEKEQRDAAFLYCCKCLDL